EPRGLSAAKLRAHASAAEVLRGSTTRSLAPSNRGVGAAVALGIGAEHAAVEIVIGVGPEGVVGVRVEGVVDEVVVGVGPEQRTAPPDDDRMRIAASPLGIEESPLEGRTCQCARGGITGGRSLGEELVAQHAAGDRSVTTGDCLPAAGSLQAPLGLSLRH